MFPFKLRGRPRNVWKFELIAPDGRVYQFPHPSLWQRLTRYACSRADVAAVSVAILVLVYIAGFAADVSSALDACCEGIKRSTGMS